VYKRQGILGWRMTDV